MKLKKGDFVRSLYKKRVFKVVTLVPERNTTVLEDDIGWCSSFKNYELDMYFRKLIWPLRWYHQFKRWSRGE